MKTKCVGVILLVCVSTVGVLLNFSNSSAKNKYLDSNLEALAQDENEAINIYRCYMESGSFGPSKTLCHAGTTTIANDNGYPVGDIYPCSSKLCFGSLFGGMGYCYKKK